MSITLPKIFLDSSDPEETRKAKGLLGKIDGQTTNPSLVAKNPEVQAYVASGKTLTETELLARYKDIIGQIELEVAGPLSVEVYADWESTASDLLKQAEDMATWGKNIAIKFPTIPEGLKAAREFTAKGGRANMTLVFTQEQSAAVYSATLPENPDNEGKTHFISPFIGRWDDRGFQGLDLIKNIVKMYRAFDKTRNAKSPHVEVLAASIRSLDHFYASIYLGADAVTIPLKTIQAWIAEEKWMPDERYRVPSNGLKSLLYKELPLQADFTEYEIDKTPGSLLDEGLTKFAKDWNKLLGK